VKLKVTKALVTSIATSVGLLGASAGIVFGVSAGMYKVRYMDLETMQTRINSALTQNTYSQNVSSKWNMNENLNPLEMNISDAKWKLIHGDTIPQPNKAKNGDTINWTSPDAEANAKNKWKYVTMCIDGSTHSTLDRSFNQGLYNGIVNFIQGVDVNGTDLKSDSTTMPSTVLGSNTAASFKPAEDNNNGLTSTYKAIASPSTSFRMLGLAGFNHVSPLGDLGTVDESGRFVFSQQYKDIEKMLMLLIDGTIPNNQNISSVLFRSDQPGFLTSVATCMYFYNNLHTYHKGYRNLSVGLYGGNPIPTVTVYLGGFERGVEFFNKFILLDGMLKNEFKNNLCIDPDPIGTLETNPDFHDLKNLIDYSKTKSDIYAFLRKEQSSYTTADAIIYDLYNEYKIRVIQLGKYATHFTGSFNSGDAIGITKQYLARGASAIVAVAGPQSLDSAQEIQNQGSDCIVVGVDTPMENGQYQRAFGRKGFTDQNVAKTKAWDPEDPTKEITVESKPAQRDNIIKFSAVKDITTVTKKFCELAIQNKNFDVELTDGEGKGTGQPHPLRSICGVGYQTCGNILNGLISISFDGWHPYVQAVKHIVGTKGWFADTWQRKAIEYFNSAAGRDVPSTVQKNIQLIDHIDTYNPLLQVGDTEDETITKYYSHITAILGMMLSEVKLDFSGIAIVPTFDASGNLVKVEEAKGEAAKMSVLDWLTSNMYFTC